MQSKDKARGPNKSTIRFDVSEGRAISASGGSLRAALNDACVPDLATTMRKKSHQLQSLGFEADAYSGKTAFQLEPGDELADVLLGLKKVKLRNFEVFETRFGIELPHASSTEGLLHIQPNRADVCRIIVRASDQEEPANFEAEIFVPAMKLDSTDLKLLVRASLFEIQITKRGMQLKTLPEQFNEGKFLLSEWINFFRMLTIFSSTDRWLDIVPENMPRVSGNISVSDMSDCEQSAKILKAFEDARDLFARAGVAEPLVMLNQILSVATRIVGIHALFFDSDVTPELSFQTERISQNIPMEIDALYVDAVEIAGIKLGFYAVAKMVNEIPENDLPFLQWKARSLSAKGIERIRNYQGDYDELACRAKSHTGIDTIVLSIMPI